MKMNQIESIESLGHALRIAQWDLRKDPHISEASTALIEIAVMAIEKAGTSMRDDLDKVKSSD